MKKILSIPLVLIILLSGLTLNLATHYCKGVVVATRVSLSGELATCGMEDHQNDQEGYNFNDLCCVNTSASYTFSNDYIPSVFLSEDSGNEVLDIDLPVVYAEFEEFSTSVLYFIKSPPGINNPSSVEREAICIFRI